MAASTAKVPLPCKGTHSCVSPAPAICSRRAHTRAVIWLKSLSQEPQSRSMLCLVRRDVVRGPGVSSSGSALIGYLQALAGNMRVVLTPWATRTVKGAADSCGSHVSAETDDFRGRPGKVSTVGC